LIRAAYLGPQGTFSEECAMAAYQGQAHTLLQFPTIDTTILAVTRGEADECVVPVENSIEGSVNVTMDMLAHTPELFIRREVVWPVRQQFLVDKEYDGVPIRLILSHEQGLAQCRMFLERMYPDAERRIVKSTAAAAKMLEEAPPGTAAIAGKRAAELFHLRILHPDIQDNSDNCTRFFVLGRGYLPPETGQGSSDGRWKTSIVCRIRGDRPGSLCAVLQEIANRSVNLTKIESRPAKTSLGEYLFFLDMDGSSVSPSVFKAIEAVKSQSLWFKNLGSYPCITL